ncbi:receptor-like protein 43 [Dioscorea cayenensis subsp. rotundata]|uniref:Receptor-like protein 43 n=1 Tax=Dioscorea cayennensis subsp. rotundata TaxID=55577 RepID=A0AB40B1Y3_DIOCR|nr:receptor-like protein 43 [Dioscorea cayenensis subsp. rotundata]
MPASVEDIRNLQFLDLSRSMMIRAIPESFGNLTLLQYFDRSGDLSQNAISGKLPESIGNLSQLQQLKMESNGITSGLPKSAGKLSSLRENKDGSAAEIREGLTALRLGKNMLNGTVPVNIGQLSKLGQLHLPLNSLMGVLTPSPVANLVNLAYLDLSYNSLQLNNMFLQSNLPHFPTWVKTQTKFGDLRLSDAGISCNIPACFPLFFCNLTTIELLDVSNNDMSGRPPSCWNSTSALGIIDLSDNNFIEQLSKLSSLQILDLAHNNLSGCIPHSFGDFKAMLSALGISLDKYKGPPDVILQGILRQLVTVRGANVEFQANIPKKLLNSFKVLSSDPIG